MNCFLVDPRGRRIGPYTPEELRLFLARGLIDADTPIARDASDPPRPVSAFLDALERGILEGQDAGPGEAGRFAGRASLPRDQPGGANHPEAPSATRDFLRLAPHLMMPLEDLVRLRWLDNRRIVALAFVGLLPLLLILHLQSSRDIGAAIWGIALYSSLLWAMFFYVAFSQPEVTLVRCVLTFAGSAIFSIGLVALARFFVPFHWVVAWINSPAALPRWSGHFFGVALIEEASKLFMLYFLWPRRLRPRVTMFYGLMAGLGFGIYEGVAYQSSQNLRVSFGGGLPTVEGAAVYYLLNILRLTSLPFLHAMWTGIAGYFIGFAGRFPERRGGLVLAAFLVPSLLHATYNTFSASLIGVAVALVTVLALNLYLVKGQDFERVLASPSSR
jgi:RsiW-degrading membrane proteinase PrsW (M82 family)